VAIKLFGVAFKFGWRTGGISFTFQKRCVFVSIATATHPFPTPFFLSTAPYFLGVTIVLLGETLELGRSGSPAGGWRRWSGTRRTGTTALSEPAVTICLLGRTPNLFCATVVFSWAALEAARARGARISRTTNIWRLLVISATTSQPLMTPFVLPCTPHFLGVTIVLLWVTLKLDWFGSPGGRT